MSELDNNFLVKAMTIDLKHWVEGFYFYNPSSKQHLMITAMVEGLAFNVEINPFTLCRCSGKTLNGQLLYENDIIIDSQSKMYKIEFGKNDYGCDSDSFPVYSIGSLYTSDAFELHKLEKLINSDFSEVFITTDSIRNARGDLFSYLFDNNIKPKSQRYNHNIIELEDKSIRIFPSFDRKYRCGIDVNKDNNIFMNFSFRIKLGQ